MFRWLAFFLCLAVFVTAMAWISARTLELEEARRANAVEAQVQEKIRLALWRMEAVAGALMIRENARPAHHYQAFYTPEDLIVSPAEAMPQGRALLPSPLFGNLSDMVKLHFEKAGGAGFMCSPQVPMGAQRELAAAWFVTSPQMSVAAERLAELESLLKAHPGVVEEAWRDLPQAPPPAPALPPNITVRALDANAQTAFNRREQIQRDNLMLQNVAQQKLEAQQMPQKNVTAAADGAKPAAGKSQDAAWTGDFTARWLDGELLLARPARQNGQPRLQGVWLDWPLLQTRLIEAARDLLPDMILEPLRADARDEWMALVSLPVRLLPGSVPVEGINGGSALKPALTLAWACLIAAAAAIAFVLHRAMTLSERRGAFVSAVTHELRTPLTTFRLYSEMLADDMVPEAEQRKSYLKTLCDESTRLTHLVENVLSFSRIERGRAAVRLESVTVEALLERMTARLRERCAQAGLQLETCIEESARAAILHVDAMAVEQILFNLTDNACKYAAPDSDPKILRIEAAKDGGKIRFTVRDFGPGLSAAQKKKLFQPFSKSATEAAHSAPGVGLGLALSRRLARELGGDLTHERPADRGAAFRLTLEIRGDQNANARG